MVGRWVRMEGAWEGGGWRIVENQEWKGRWTWRKRRRRDTRLEPAVSSIHPLAADPEQPTSRQLARIKICPGESREYSATRASGDP